MKITAHISQAISTIFSHKLRSGLTMLGVIIGIASVIVMVALGTGAQEGVSARLRSLGTNVLIVTPGGGSDIRSVLRGGGNGTLSMKDVSLVSTIENVIGVSPEVSVNKQAIYGKSNTNLRMTGVLPQYADYKQKTLVSGRFFTEEEYLSMSRVIVIDERLEREFFEGNALGVSFRLGDGIFRIVGIVSGENREAFIPLSTAQIRLLGNKNIHQIFVFASDEPSMSFVQSDIEFLLLSSRKISSMDAADFSVINQSDMIETLNEVTAIFTFLLAGIAAISLLVGGIGVMNIMLVSVTERTREIGIRKAVGAHKNDILAQFLIEAMIVSLMGGIVGIVLSFAAVTLIQSFGIVARITPDSVIIATSFSLAVGLFFGIFPAYKASRLNPIDALRYE